MMAVTIKDVAKKAGVSYSTVSRALNDPKAEKSDKKRRILKIAEEMGYVPNQAAINLKMSRSYVIGLYFSTISKMTSPFVLHDVLTGVYSVVGSKYNVVVKGIDMYEPGTLNPKMCIRDRVNSYYWCCDPDGHSEYVSTKEALPVDERTPQIKQLAFRNIEAHNCHVAAAFLYGLPESKMEEVSFENVHIDFAENPTPEYPAMMADVEPCTRKGIYINNAKKVVLKNVTVEGAEGEPIEIENADEVIRG